MDVSFSMLNCNFLLLPVLFLVTIMMVLKIMTFGLLCRLQDDYYCIVSAWCSRFHRPHRFVSVYQVRTAFTSSAKQMCHILTLTVRKDNTVSANVSEYVLLDLNEVMYNFIRRKKSCTGKKKKKDAAKR